MNSFQLFCLAVPRYRCNQMQLCCLHGGRLISKEESSSGGRGNFIGGGPINSAELWQFAASVQCEWLKLDEGTVGLSCGSLEPGVTRNSCVSRSVGF
jgi:hypothetical protein